MIDLHCHSCFSDGLLSPADLLAKAIHAKVRLLALTDHDSVAGLNLLNEAAFAKDIQIVNGIELSVRWKKHDIHILGLNINPKDTVLTALIAKQHDSRQVRALQISECLSHLGIQNAYQKACDIAGHGAVGRPHFAQVLVNEGIVKDIQTAFKRFLGRGKGAYVPTPWCSVETAVAAITHAGGQAVIAHPLKYKLTRSKLHDLISVFKSAGGEGMEVISGGMTSVQINELASLCERFKLYASTGSDYHGDAISNTNLGQQQQLPLNCTPIWHKWNTTFL
ncbi:MULTISPECIES: PHP domain-containing protein [Legionella]|uniref:PHP domain-containing protein n=1 Tax=Legionella TaxID=445 RepID=UPI000F8EA87B|nr:MULTISPECIES: PHP domain-containing protein [Legionella]MCP0913498.1 PHP domain-containing protein [Legionella sp. 27cVA30]RUQ99729.1 PHP domain-containing protein [Legionella septentrionalis]